MKTLRLAVLLSAMHLMLAPSAWGGLAEGLVSLIPLEPLVSYDFEDQSLGPIGSGGPEAGQPARIGFGVHADVIEFGTDNKALQISRTTAGGQAVSFELPGGLELNQGLVRIRFKFTPLEYDNLNIAVGSPTSTGGGFIGIRPRSDGSILAASAGLGLPTIGTYTPGETLSFTLDFNLDRDTWSAELNGEVVITNRAILADSVLGRIHFGYWGTGEDRQPMVVDDIEVLVGIPLVTLLDADFNDKTLDAPIGTGGPGVSEPVAINSNLTTEVVSFAGDDKALNIEKTGTVFANVFADWTFLNDVAISEGLLIAEFDLTPRNSLAAHLRLEASPSSGSPEELVRITTESSGDVRVRFPDEVFGTTVGSYEVNETLRVFLSCNLDERHCSVALDGSWVLLARSFAPDTSADIAVNRFLSGFSGLSAVDTHYDLNNLRIRATHAPGIPHAMSFNDQPVDLACAVGQPLDITVTDINGGPAADMIDVHLLPDHPDLTPSDLVGVTSFTWEGVAEFPSVMVLRRANNLRLVAEIDDPFNPVTVISEPFNALPGSPSSALYLDEPSDGFVGQAFDPPVSLQIFDSCGESSVAGREISLFIFQGPDGATLSGNTAVTNVHGQVVFPALSIDQPGNYRLAALFEGTGLGGSSSDWFEIAVAPTASASFQTQPSTVVATAAMTPAVEVLVEDIFDQPVADGTPVTLELVEPGTAELSGATANTIDGVAVFDALQISQPGTFQLRASVPDLPGEAEPVSDSFDVVAGPAALLSFEAQPTSTAAGQTISPAVTVRVTDANGFDVSDGEMVSVSLAVAPTGAELDGTLSRTTAGGLATFDDLSLAVAGQYVLDAELSSGAASSSALFEISPADPFLLSFTVPPSNARVNRLVFPIVTVSAEDAFGNAVSDGVPITLAIVEGPGSASLSGAVSNTLGGEAEFPALTIDQLGSFRLQARADDVPVDNRPISEPFNIFPGPPETLSFSQQPTDTEAGAAISPAVAVSVVDSDGFAVADDTLVRLTLASGPAEADLLGDLESETLNGIATFANLSIQLTGQYTIEAEVVSDLDADAGLSVISDEFQISSAGPNVLTFLSPPSDGTVNQPLSPAVQVEARDEFGNLVTGARTVNLVVSESPTGGSASGRSADTVNGIATFDALTMDTPGTWQLRADSSDVPFENRPTSAPFDIAPGAPASLEFEQQPATVVIDETLSPAVSVRVLDADGFSVVDGTPVELSVASGPEGAVLSGTLTRNTASGLAVFDDLSLDAVGSYTLQASVNDGALVIFSTSFNVIDTGPASASFLSQPSDTPAGQPMSPAVAVEVLDSEAGPVADGSAVVLVLVDPGEASLTGAVATTVDGVAVFEALTVNRPGSYQLRAEVSGLDPAAAPVSEIFEIGPGPAASLVIEQQPSATFAGQVIAPAVRVRLVDEFGTTVPDGLEITITELTGTADATLTGTLTRTTVDGVATFNDLAIDQPGSDYALVFSHADLSETSATFAVFADRIFHDRFETED